MIVLVSYVGTLYIMLENLAGKKLREANRVGEAGAGQRSNIYLFVCMGGHLSQVHVADY